jgi:hypothetical protein
MVTHSKSYPVVYCLPWLCWWLGHLSCSWPSSALNLLCINYSWECLNHQTSMLMMELQTVCEIHSFNLLTVQDFIPSKYVVIFVSLELLYCRYKSKIHLSPFSWDTVAPVSHVISSRASFLLLLVSCFAYSLTLKM